MRETVGREENAGGFPPARVQAVRRAPLARAIPSGTSRRRTVRRAQPHSRRERSARVRRRSTSPVRELARSPGSAFCPCPAPERVGLRIAASLAFAAQASGPDGRPGPRCPCETARSVARRDRSPGRRGHDWRSGRWPPAAPIRPVLKHGPRSATRARVLGRQPPGRSESEGAPDAPRWEPGPRATAHHRPIPSAPRWDSSESVPVATRKMVNYARAGRSQGKPWWRPAAILTCKSIV